MRHVGGPLTRACFLAAVGLSLGCQPGARLASIGDLQTERGEVIRDCRVGYRTYGRLDASGSNAVLLLPWLLGTAREAAAQIGPGRLVDGSRLFVVVVDPLGNGVSSSPSNSPAQPGSRFPRITVGDMVRSQHALVTRVLGLGHLKAIVGVSLGGMQALGWATAHPGFADGIVSIAGSPRIAERDRRAWRARAADVAARPAWKGALGALVDGHPQDALRLWHTDPMDHAAQAEAIADLDLSTPFGGSMARAAEQASAKLLVVVSARDDLVDPEPAVEFARMSGAELLVLDGRCGHDAPRCERSVLSARVGRFLEGLRDRTGAPSAPPDAR